MTQTGRTRFDADVALATSAARTPVLAAPVPPFVPRWRVLGSRVKQLVRRLLRPLRAPQAGAAGQQPSPELLALCESVRQESREQLQSLQRALDAAREELRLLHTGLVDDVHATRSSAERELAALHARSDAMFAAIAALQRAQAGAAAPDAAAAAAVTPPNSTPSDRSTCSLPGPARPPGHT
jgi:hypothetical protein